WYPPVEPVAATQLNQVLDAMAPGEPLRLAVAGETLTGDSVSKTVVFQVPPVAGAEARLLEIGLELREEEGRVFVDNLIFGSPAEAARMDFDWEILHLERA